MGRHQKPSDLSSSYPTGFSRIPFTIRKVRCCIWWPANKIPSVIPLAVIVCFLICLKLFIVQIWCLRKIPEDHEYPDGFTCPDSTHKILDHRNVTISCKSCLECPLGQQLLPSCGSTTKLETSIECRNCPPDTYKESQGTGKCKPCQTCGLRETISQCTPEKNALCGECPRGYYQEDYTLDSCMRCSSCCWVKRFAELECIYLKQCVRKNCTQQLEIKESGVFKMGVAKLFATESTAHERAVTRRSASQSDNPAPTRDWVWVDHGGNVKLLRAGSASQRVEEAITYPLKGNYLNPANPASVEGNGFASLSTPQSKLHKSFGTAFGASVGEPPMQSIPSNSGNVSKLLTILSGVLKKGVAKLFATELTAHERAGTRRSASQSDNPAPTRDWVWVDHGVIVKIQRAESASQRVEEAITYTLKGNNLNPANPPSVEDNGLTSLSTPQSKLQKGFGTAFDASVGEPPMQSIPSNSGNVSKLLTILIVFVGIAIVLILIAIIMAWKNRSGHFPGGSCTVTCCPKNIYFRDVDEYRSLIRDTFQTDSEIAHTSDNGAATSSENNAEIDDIENLALCELPPTLENILIKKLDVLHKGEYGWKKLGEAFEIDNDDLTYLETAYKRNVGSPTKELLEILDKTQRRTFGEVLNKLKGSHVNRPDIARLKRQKWQEI